MKLALARFSRVNGARIAPDIGRRPKSDGSVTPSIGKYTTADRQDERFAEAVACITRRDRDDDALLGFSVCIKACDG